MSQSQQLVNASVDLDASSQEPHGPSRAPPSVGFRDTASQLPSRPSKAPRKNSQGTFSNPNKQIRNICDRRTGLHKDCKEAHCSHCTDATTCKKTHRRKDNMPEYKLAVSISTPPVQNVAKPRLIACARCCTRKIRCRNVVPCEECVKAGKPCERQTEGGKPKTGYKRRSLAVPTDNSNAGAPTEIIRRDFRTNVSDASGQANLHQTQRIAALGVSSFATPSDPKYQTDGAAHQQIASQGTYQQYHYGLEHGGIDGSGPEHGGTNGSEHEHYGYLTHTQGSAAFVSIREPVHYQSDGAARQQIASQGTYQQYHYGLEHGGIDGSGYGHYGYLNHPQVSTGSVPSYEQVQGPVSYGPSGNVMGPFYQPLFPYVDSSSYDQVQDGDLGLYTTPNSAQFFNDMSGPYGADASLAGNASQFATPLQPYLTSSSDFQRQPPSTSQRPNPHPRRPYTGPASDQSTTLPHRRGPA